MELSEIIIEKIRKNGPISFRDFMEISLYYPDAGYYTSAAAKTGKHGDYYTSPHISRIFGHMIGKQLEEMWSLLGKQSFSIVEYGGGSGLLCRDILEYCKNNNEFYSKINYLIIEKNAKERENAEKKSFEVSNPEKKVYWFESIRDIPEITGCILSNELIDNFPVHQVEMHNELMEVVVDYRDGFVEKLRPAPKLLKEYLEELNVVLSNGTRTEINLQAIDWINEIAGALKRGFVLTIDYGYPSSELYNRQRRLGTLLCYYRHTINDRPFNNIGRQDITSHVNFSALRHWGLKTGLEYCGFTNQAHFLHSLGLADHVKKIEEYGKEIPAGNNEKTLLIHKMLLEMGTKYKVLIQQKGMVEPRLSGLRFSQQLF